MNNNLGDGPSAAIAAEQRLLNKLLLGDYDWADLPKGLADWLVDPIHRRIYKLIERTFDFAGLGAGCSWQTLAESLLVEDGLGTVPESNRLNTVGGANYLKQLALGPTAPLAESVQLIRTAAEARQAAVVGVPANNNVLKLRPEGRVAPISPEDWRWQILSDALHAILAEARDLQHARELAGNALVAADEGDAA